MGVLTDSFNDGNYQSAQPFGIVVTGEEPLIEFQLKIYPLVSRTVSAGR